MRVECEECVYFKNDMCRHLLNFADAVMTSAVDVMLFRLSRKLRVQLLQMRLSPEIVNSKGLCEYYEGVDYED